MELTKYSLGIGDRFGHQGNAQLAALKLAEEKGLTLTPVWNKSFREHQILHTSPIETRESADAAVLSSGWKHPFFVDADHITLNNVDSFIPHCDFFTLDVADYIGMIDNETSIDKFVERNRFLNGSLEIEGISPSLAVTDELLRKIGSKYSFAIKKAAELYRHIEEKKGRGNFIVEISMDEVNEAQTPVDLYFILLELVREGVPVNTIAPKFSGRFNKGVDYVGNIGKFSLEIEQFMLVLRELKKKTGFQAGLKLSIHSGSDKFSLYPVIGNLMRKYNQGIHLKTAGTTWLEELIGLALSGDEALEIAKNIYVKALARYDELCAPYSTVIDIPLANLPATKDLLNWSGSKFANTLRHVPGNPDFNPAFRQLMHVSYKIAAEYSNVFIHLLNANNEMIGRQVTENLYNRHIVPLFKLS